MIEKFKKLIKKVQNLDEEVDFYGSNSNENIDKIANELQINFDENLISYLSEFGGGGVIDMLHTNGIIPNDPLSDNIYTVYGATIYARNEYHLAPHFLVLNSNFPSDALVMDTKTGKIYNYQTNTETIGRVLYDDFQTYLISS